MKTIISAIITLAYLACASSCTKSNNTYSRSIYTCYCYWTKSPTKDTSTFFYYPGDTAKSAAQDACGQKDTWVKSLSGPGGAYCRLD